jgi:hypothetical protein
MKALTIFDDCISQKQVGYMLHVHHQVRTVANLRDENRPNY